MPVCGGLLGKHARSLCSVECRRLGKAANGRARYELKIVRPVRFTVDYRPRRDHRDGSLTAALGAGDSPGILAAVRRLAEPAGECLLWTQDDVKGFGRFRYQGMDLRVHRVVAQDYGAHKRAGSNKPAATSSAAPCTPRCGLLNADPSAAQQVE